MESATENNRHHDSRMVRVKTGGKSARCMLAIVIQGKTLPGARQNRHVRCFVPV